MNEELKLCTKCRVEKQSADFAKNASRPDGLRPHCRICEKAYPSSSPEAARKRYLRFKERHPEAASLSKRRYREKYPRALKASQQRYREENAAPIAAYNAAYRAANPKIYRDASKRYGKANPEQVLAMRAINGALKRGSLVAQLCFCCGETAEAHHSSYDRDMRLAVTWLCRKHHKQLHKEARRAQSASAPSDL